MAARSRGGSREQAAAVRAQIRGVALRSQLTLGRLNYNAIRTLHSTALQTYKSELGETNPITLRNVSNLQLLNLEEAEGLEKDEAKPIINAAKYEMEGALETFVSLDDPWTYRLDVASLKTNLGFVAVWQGKPKKARKMVRQLKEIEVPVEHSLAHRIETLEERVEELERKKQ